MEDQTEKDSIAISLYFSGLFCGYPPVTECSAVLKHALGTVYIVTFDPRVLSAGTNATQPPCYAIVKDGKVSGYSKDFWSEADKYRLVLKQHLGMLEMERIENARDVEAPKETPIENPVKVQPNPYIIELVVLRYEEIIAKLNEKLTTTEETLKINIELERAERKALQEKLDLIKKAVDGTPQKETAKESEKSLEEVMIGQDSYSDSHDDSVNEVVGYGGCSKPHGYPVKLVG